MTATLWIFLGLCLGFLVSYILETQWMIGWATYIVSKIRIYYNRLVK
jgi:hypothetical protein